MKINLIVALCEDGGIGMSGSMPWNIKEDMKHFYNTTTKSGVNAVVMGRKTWDSLNHNPLKNRFNFVLTREIDTINTLNYNNVLACSSIDEILNYCNLKEPGKFDNLWVIGGTQIYNAFLDYRCSHVNEDTCIIDTCIIDACIITYINKEYECDTYFPIHKIKADWYMTEQTTLNEYATIQYWRHAVPSLPALDYQI